MSPSVDRKIPRAAYRALVRQIRDTVDAQLPPDAAVLTVGKGDRELAKLGTRRTGHYPQDEAGQYAGHYPADTSAAIAHLDTLIAAGYDHILFPRTAYWWFDHYAGLEEHLNRHGSRVRHRGDHCRLWALRTGPARAVSARSGAAVAAGWSELETVSAPTDPQLNARIALLLDALLEPGVAVGHLRRPSEPTLRLVNRPVVSVELPGGEGADPDEAIQACERLGASVVLLLRAEDPHTAAGGLGRGGTASPTSRALDHGLLRIAHREHLCSLYHLRTVGRRAAGQAPLED